MEEGVRGEDVNGKSRQCLRSLAEEDKSKDHNSVR